jgi:uncharacterized repeat protein (TIGR01451 family)
MDTGKIVDTATATGTDTQGLRSPTSTPSTATVLAEAGKPTVALRKTATVNPASDHPHAKQGDTIAYAFIVTNTGNVSLRSLSISDPTAGPVTCPTPASPGLAPGASETCKAQNNHLVTQADVAAGKVTNTATAAGTDARGTVSPPSDPSTVIVPAAASAPPVVSTTTATTVAAASAAPATQSAPNGLGQIATDLGRWLDGSGPETWAVWAGIAAVTGGVTLVEFRRRRSRTRPTPGRDSGHVE